jgi:hypothetical protein
MINIRNRRRFEVSLDEFADQIGVDVATVVKKLSFDIFADVVAVTPVDTGRAMNNWVISVGSPSRHVTSEGGAKSGVAASKASEAAGALATVSPFDTVWISNNLPYIGFLEEGSSDQAPSGWVERAIQNNLRQLARFAL